MLAALTIPLVSAQTYSCPMSPFSAGSGFGFSILSWAIEILILVALVLLAAWLFKQVTKKK